MENLNSYVENAIVLLMNYLPSLALAIVVLIVGFWLIKKITNLFRMSLHKANFSADITPFLISLVDGAFKVLLLFSVAGIVGIETASFVAVLAAAGFAVGLALQGSLGNFAAGIVILTFKPYRVGDWVDIQEKFGKVEEIQIFNTIVVTPGQKTLIIPNGQVIEGIVTNFSAKGCIRLELEVTIPYEENFPRVREIIFNCLQDIPGLVKDLKPEVGILRYDSHNIVIAIRPFIRPDDYWDTTYDTYGKIKAAFHEHNIKVAYSEGIELGPIGA